MPTDQAFLDALRKRMDGDFTSILLEAVSLFGGGSPFDNGASPSFTSFDLGTDEGSYTHRPGQQAKMETTADRKLRLAEEKIRQLEGLVESEGRLAYERGHEAAEREARKSLDMLANANVTLVKRITVLEAQTPEAWHQMETQLREITQVANAREQSLKTASWRIADRDRTIQRQQEQMARLSLQNVRSASTPGPDLSPDAEMLRRLIQLTHPDRHNQSESSKIATQWLLKRRTR